MKEFYLNGMLFSGSEEELLAIKEFRYKQWYQNRKLHRTDGPAVIFPNGSQSWYQNNKRHRTDGPAVIYPNGYKEWHIEGYEFTYFFNLFFPMKRFIKYKYPG